MSQFHIITDSGCDLNQAMIEKLNITVVPLMVNFKGATQPEGVPTAIVEAQDWVSIASATVMEYDCDIKGPNMSSLLAMVGTGDLTPAEGIAEIEADNAIDAQQKGLAGW